MNAESKTPRPLSKAVRRFRCVSMVNSLAKNWQKWASDHTHKQKTQPLGWQPGGSSEDYAKKPTLNETEIQPAKVPQMDIRSSSFNGENVASSKEQKEYQEAKVSIRTVTVNKTVSTRQTAKSNELVSFMSGRFNQPVPEEAPKPFLGDRSPTRRRLRLSKASELVQSWKTAEKEGQDLVPKCNLASDGGREKRKEGIEEESKDKDGTDDRGKRKKLVQKVQVRTMGELKKVWLRWAEDHIEKQKLNPFSDDFDYDYAMSFRLKKGDRGYGRPKEGSKSAERGERAQRHIRREIDELCYIIRDLGIQGKDGMTRVTFGQLFDRYVTISDKVVGILMRARKHGLVDFPGEMLWQGRDDDVIITLMELQNPEY
ncbi:actin-binding Rho-activating protein-like [Hypanus sabinus]|uniref:actin-binding Rho-activating protein-like n=1 Tax=Hypanus sabinus TaxID=79690 RepID=UPI0028C48F67|nr:actin-binding Rho-activating protein-like [Hypanus sabinus]